MKFILPLLLLVIGLFSCRQDNTSSSTPAETKEKVEFQETIATELAKLAELDQTAAGLPLERFGGWTDEWKQYKDSVFRTNKLYLEQILNEYGYPGIDLVGEEGSYNFWLMTQHCDFDPSFQEKVLTAMKTEVKKGNADKSNYAYLADRIRKNKGEKLLYGTQVTYHPETAQAMSYPLEDSLNVNARRKKMGLEPLEVYLNQMSISHFEMNKENMKERGIEAPTLYKLDK